MGGEPSRDVPEMARCGYCGKPSPWPIKQVMAAVCNECAEAVAALRASLED